MACDGFLCGFKAHGAAHAASSAPWLRSRYSRANAGRLARKAKVPQGRSQPRSSRAAATITGRLRKLVGDHVQLPDDITRTPRPVRSLRLHGYRQHGNGRPGRDQDDQPGARRSSHGRAHSPRPPSRDSACQNSSRSVAVVSNNSAAAVHSYLTRYGLDDWISPVVARTNHDPASSSQART